MTRSGTAAALWLSLGTLACAPKANTYQDHLEREMSFLRTGVDVDAEARAVRATLEKAGLEIVTERQGEGLRALGAASPRFARTAVRVITGRGVVEAEDGVRDDLLDPGRVHLLESVARELSGRPVVGWVWLSEGATAGCARLRIIDRAGRPLPVQLAPAALFPTACAGGLERQQGALWGSLVWPELTAAETPLLELPLRPEKPKLDEDKPMTRLVLEDREGWLAQARERRLERLSERSEFGLRHPLALELAALALLAGDSGDAQRGAYTQHAGAPEGRFERGLWQAAVDLIERGWLQEGGGCADGAERPGEGSGGCVETPEPESQGVLQEPVHGQEAQKEEGLTR